MKYYVSNESALPGHPDTMHRENCYHCRISKHTRYLGDYPNDSKALECAQSSYKGDQLVDWCEYCCLDLYDTDRQLNFFS